MGGVSIFPTNRWHRCITFLILCAALPLLTGAMISDDADRGPETTNAAIESTAQVQTPPPPTPAPGEGEAAESPSVQVQVANLIYGTKNKTSVCFANGYLHLLAREIDIDVARKPVSVKLSDPNLFNYPFAIMSGEGAYTLTDADVTQMADYLNSGGFILASAGCSNSAWNTSFRREFQRVMPETKLVELSLEHEVFQTVFNVTSLQTKARHRKVKLYGLEIDGRLCLIYTPEGLNDTGNAGGGCCCCGGNEIRNAKYINANILAYALQQ